MMIIICHCNGYGVFLPYEFRYILSWGNLGVDVFLFLSGIGCYYSLIKKRDTIQWLKRRYSRVFVPYTMCIVVQWVFLIILGKFDFKEDFYIYTTLAFWTEHKGFWYIALLIPLYLLTPLLFQIFERTSNRIILSVVLVLIIYLLCYIPIGVNISNLLYNILSNIQVSFIRVISFIIGMAIGPWVKNGRTINIWLLILSFVGIYVIISYLYPTVFTRWCWVVPFCIFACYCVNLIKNSKILYCFFTWMGVASLELYITNGSFQVIVREISMKFLNSQLFMGRYFEYILIIVGGFVVSYFIHKLSNIVIKPQNI